MTALLRRAVFALALAPLCLALSLFLIGAFVAAALVSLLSEGGGE
jgi:hypothetical protein